MFYITHIWTKFQCVRLAYERNLVEYEQVSDWNNAILNGPDFLRNSFKEQCLPNDLVQGTTSGIVAHAIWFILIQLLRTEDMHDKTGH